MTDNRNLDKLDRDWRRQSENIDREEKEKRPNENDYNDELDETLKKRAHIDDYPIK